MDRQKLEELIELNINKIYSTLESQNKKYNLWVNGAESRSEHESILHGILFHLVYEMIMDGKTPEEVLLDLDEMIEIGLIENRS